MLFKAEIYKILSGWSPENENFANLGKFEAAKGVICNLFLQQDFIQITSTGKLEDTIRRRTERSRFTGTETHKAPNMKFLNDRCAFQGKGPQPHLIY